MIDFSNLAVAGIPLILVIAGLVAFAKDMGLAGRALTGLSLGLGVVFGIAYQFSTNPPKTLAEYFATIVFGLGLGLTTSGLYNMVRQDFFGKS